MAELRARGITADPEDTAWATVSCATPFRSAVDDRLPLPVVGAWIEPSPPASRPPTPPTPLPAMALDPCADGGSDPCQLPTGGQARRISSFVRNDAINWEGEDVQDLLRQRFFLTCRTSNIDKVLAWHPTYLSSFSHFTETIMWKNGPLSVPERLYLAIMAASRHYCRCVERRGGRGLGMRVRQWGGGD